MSRHNLLDWKHAKNGYKVSIVEILSMPVLRTVIQIAVRKRGFLLNSSLRRGSLYGMSLTPKNLRHELREPGRTGCHCNTSKADAHSIPDIKSARCLQISVSPSKISAPHDLTTFRICLRVLSDRQRWANL